MNGFRIRTLQDLSHILPAKSLQHETHVTTNTFKRCLSSFFNFSCKEENACETKRINLSIVPNTHTHNLEPISTTWMALPDITTTTLSSRSPIHYLHFKVYTEIMRPETLKPLIKYNELLDENSISRSKYYKTLPNVQAGDFGFVHNDNNDKVYCDNCSSKMIVTLQGSQEPRIDHRIAEVWSDDLSTCTTMKNVDSPSPAKPELKTPKIKQGQSRDRLKLRGDQHSQEYDLSQSPEIRAYMEENFSIIQCVLQTPAVISKPLPSSFATLQQSNRMMKMQECTKDAAETSRFDKSTHFGSSRNQGPRNPSSYLTSVPRRVFSSRSCTAIQKSIREIENLRMNLSANVSIVRLRSTRSHSGRISIAKLQSFSCDASKLKKSADCEKNDKSQRSKGEVETKDYGACSQQIARNPCRTESEKISRKRRSRRKNTYGRDSVSSRNNAYEKRREGKSKLYVCPELKRQLPCNWNEERCPEARRKCDAKGRASSRDCTRQSRDPNSEKQDTDTRCSKKRRSKSWTRREEPDNLQGICKDSVKKKNNCESKCEKRDTSSDKERRKSTGNHRKRSNSCRRRNSSRASDKSCRKIDGKRYYSQQSIFFVSRDRKSLSTLIPDTVLDTNVNKITQRFYASCNKGGKDPKQGPSCEKRKRKCGTKEKDEAKKKCVKGPAKCMSRKKTIDKMQTCQSMQKDKDKKSHEPTKKPSNLEEYCASRKKEFMKDEKLKEKPAKVDASPTEKDKKPKEQSIKRQIDREYKEIDECKKGTKKEKKDGKAKMVSTEYKPTNRMMSSLEEQQKEDSEKFTSTPNESIISTNDVFKSFNIQPKIINGINKIPIFAKDGRLFNAIFHRLFSTAKLNYQDDFAIERTADRDRMAQNSSANSDDFIHGDELPNYVEIENEEEEDDVHGN